VAPGPVRARGTSFRWAYARPVQLPRQDDIERAGARARIVARRATTPVAAVAILACFAALAAILFYSAPKRIVSSTDVPDAAQRLKLQNDVRTTGTQLLVGIVLAAGAVFTARTFRLNREGQITERYTRAVEQIGSTNLRVRMGGIYALERIARESATDHGPIFEVLCALARTSVRRPEDKPEAALPDVQAVLRVIARRRSSQDPAADHIELDNADLRGCNLEGADLRQASLQEVNLRDSVVSKCDLRNALFTLRARQTPRTWRPIGTSRSPSPTRRASDPRSVPPWRGGASPVPQAPEAAREDPGHAGADQRRCRRDRRRSAQGNQKVRPQEAATFESDVRPRGDQGPEVCLEFIRQGIVRIMRDLQTGGSA
jgi:hypothetical protein